MAEPPPLDPKVKVGAFAFDLRSKCPKCGAEQSGRIEIALNKVEIEGALQKLKEALSQYG